MTDPTLYRDDSRVRHILGAIERIIEVGADMSRDQGDEVSRPGL